MNIYSQNVFVVAKILRPDVWATEEHSPVPKSFFDAASGDYAASCEANVYIEGRQQSVATAVEILEAIGAEVHPHPAVALASGSANGNTDGR